MRCGGTCRTRSRRPSGGSLLRRDTYDGLWSGKNCCQSCYPSGPAASDAPTTKGPTPAFPQVTGPSPRRRMGDSNPRGLSPNTLSKCLNGGWEVLARVRFRRSARCADDSHDAWIGLDREELLPKLLPLRGRGTGGVEPGSRPALGQAVVALADGIGAQATSQLTRGVTGSRLGGCSARCASRDHLPGSTSWSTLPGERGSSSTTTRSTPQ